MKEKLVEKLFDGTCSIEELELLFQLIESDEEPPDDVLMERLWQETQQHPELDKKLAEGIFGRTVKKIHEKKIKQLPVSSKRKHFLAIAAGILILITGTIWLFQMSNTPTVVNTKYGEQQTLKLSDGSIVRMNANSQMVFDEYWPEGADRKIWLKGEAFFKVEKKLETNQKLKVITDDLTVEVLGTTFNVNSKENATSVYLVEGQIRLHFNAMDSILTMNPGDFITYSESKGEITLRHKQSPDLHTSWKDGVLTFRNTRLRKVLQKIEAIYGVEFKVINESDYDRVINFPLPIDELETALSILEKTVADLEVRKKENLYIIK